MTGPDPETLLQMRLALVERDPALARAHAESPPIGWRATTPGYAGLLETIVGQQVSTASADAIWKRVQAGLGQVTPEAALAAGDEALRSFGLSRPKARYALAIAEAFAHGALRAEVLRTLTDQEALAALTAVVGIGPWTAEIYLTFCEGRIDIFPAGDIALQEAIRWADGLELRPSEKATRLRAQLWAPWRGVAAHLLWAWYGAVRRREVEHPMRPVALPS
jgi:DNA-3-methyladenine glycosylase II